MAVVHCEHCGSGDTVPGADYYLCMSCGQETRLERPEFTAPSEAPTPPTREYRATPDSVEYVETEVGGAPAVAAAEAPAPAGETDLLSMSKAELTDAARDGDVEGYSSMTKAELLGALLDQHTKADLVDMARDAGVEGYSSMSKAELVEALGGE